MELPIVLLVEDDEAVQGVVADVLNEGGFEPATARTGEEAVTLLKGRQTNYCALVTDINLLGRFNGWEVARAAREVAPNFPVVYMTGAAADEWPFQGVPNSILLRKPFAPRANRDSHLTAFERRLEAGLQQLVLVRSPFPKIVSISRATGEA